MQWHELGESGNCLEYLGGVEDQSLGTIFAWKS